MESPVGDHTGAQELPPLVTRRTSAPVEALRITTSVPNVVVRVAATHFPSGEKAGLVYPGPVSADVRWVAGLYCQMEGAPREPSRPFRTYRTILPSGRQTMSWCPSGGVSGIGAFVSFFVLRL